MSATQERRERPKKKWPKSCEGCQRGIKRGKLCSACKKQNLNQWWRSSSRERKPIDQVRDALHQAGAGMSPAEWKELLEELSADIDGHLDALREEAENEAD